MAKPFRFGPLALTNTYTTNIFNPPTSTGGTNGASPSFLYTVTHIVIVEKAGTGATFRLFIGATGANAAGSEFMGYNRTVASASYVEWFGAIPFTSSDFLVGGASASTTLTIEGEGEIEVI